MRSFIPSKDLTVNSKLLRLLKKQQQQQKSVLTLDNARAVTSSTWIRSEFSFSACIIYIHSYIILNILA